MDLLDRGCTCFLGNPPCGFCEGTFECEDCGNRVITEDQETEGVHTCICDRCFSKEEEE